MPDENLKLNSLARYSKQSPRMVLEEYGSCEVPAGCGGVVLRWRNPTEPIPMVVRFFSWNGQRIERTLDGVDIQSASKLSVSCGSHVMTMIIKDSNPNFAIVLLVARLDEDYVRVLHLDGDVTILSLADGTWKYTLAAPDSNAWQQPDFDDHAWQSMVEQPFSPPPRNYGGSVASWTKDLTDAGAKALGIDTAGSFWQRMRGRTEPASSLPAVYIRKTFTITSSSQQAKSQE